MQEPFGNRPVNADGADGKGEQDQGRWHGEGEPGSKAA